MLLQHSFRTVCIFHGRLKIPERRCKHIFISHKPLLCLSSWWLQFFRAIALVYVWRCLHKLCKTQRNWIYKSPEDGRGRCPCICLSYNNIHFKTSALTMVDELSLAQVYDLGRLEEGHVVSPLAATGPCHHKVSALEGRGEAQTGMLVDTQTQRQRR